LFVGCLDLTNRNHKPTMKQLQDAATELMDEVIFALNHSMDLKRDGVDPMIPFAVL